MNSLIEFFDPRTIGIFYYAKFGAKDTEKTFKELFITETDFSSRSDVSQIPMEGGVLGSDNVVFNGREVSFSVLFTDISSSLLTSSISSLLARNVEEGLTFFNKIQQEQMFFDLKTTTRTIKGLQIQELSDQENSQNGGKSTVLTVKAKQILSFEALNLKDKARLKTNSIEFSTSSGIIKNIVQKFL